MKLKRQPIDYQERRKIALIYCPGCEKQVSSIARTCPVCGYPIASQISEDSYLRYLARNVDEWVRIGVAENPSAPADLLRMLARDKK